MIRNKLAALVAGITPVQVQSSKCCPICEQPMAYEPPATQGDYGVVCGTSELPAVWSCDDCGYLEHAESETEYD